MPHGAYRPSLVGAARLTRAARRYAYPPGTDCQPRAPALPGVQERTSI